MDSVASNLCRCKKKIAEYELEPNQASCGDSLRSEEHDVRTELVLEYGHVDDKYDDVEPDKENDEEDNKENEKQPNQALCGDGLRNEEHEVMIEPVPEGHVDDNDHVKQDEENDEENEENKEQEDERAGQENDEDEIEEADESEMEGDGEPAEEEKEEEEEKGEEEREEQEEKKQQQDKAEDGESEMEGDGEPEEEYTIFGGKKVKVEYSGTKLKALRGNMNIEYPEKTQIVRIFTSSTFTDTSVERNTLMETVYPKLKIFCQKKGFEFQDMRWGVRDEATDDHMTTELCMKELYACQKLSTGPNFITFLGQKYGYRPFPPKIEESEFQQLIKAVDDSEDRVTLQRWFKLDSNAVPQEYILQPVTSILPNYRNHSNPELRKAASSEWWSCFERIQMALRKAAIKVLDKNKQQKYVMSGSPSQQS